MVREGEKVTENVVSGRKGAMSPTFKCVRRKGVGLVEVSRE